MRHEFVIQAELARLKEAKKKGKYSFKGFRNRWKNKIILNEAINSLEWVLGLK